MNVCVCAVRDYLTQGAAPAHDPRVTLNGDARRKARGRDTRKTEIDRDGDRQRQRDRETERQRDRETERKRETEREKRCSGMCREVCRGVQSPQSPQI